MVEFKIYEILYEKYKKEFSLLTFPEMEKYGKITYESITKYKSSALSQKEFNEKLESDLDFNNRWYEKI